MRIVFGVPGMEAGEGTRSGSLRIKTRTWIRRGRQLDSPGFFTS